MYSISEQVSLVLVLVFALAAEKEGAMALQHPPSTSSAHEPDVLKFRFKPGLLGRDNGSGVHARVALVAGLRCRDERVVSIVHVAIHTGGGAHGTALVDERPFNNKCGGGGDAGIAISVGCRGSGGRRDRAVAAGAAGEHFKLSRKVRTAALAGAIEEESAFSEK